MEFAAYPFATVVFPHRYPAGGFRTQRHVNQPYTALPPGSWTVRAMPAAGRSGRRWLVGEAVDVRGIGSVVRERVEIAGVLVDRVDRAGAAEVLRRFLTDGARHQVVTVNTDFVHLAHGDTAFRSLLNQADLAVADGMPLVWLSRLQRAALPGRVAGLDLVDDACRLAAEAGIGVYLLGATPANAERASRVLVSRHPGLRIAGSFAPPFGPHTSDDEDRMVAKIRSAGRCVLFVAFGAPRQDRFIQAHLEELDVPIAIGVGGTFDVLAGSRRRAPAWVQDVGLEWLWRLAQEPRRLWRRYLMRDAPLLLRLGARAMRTSLRSSAQPL